jgi:hypothetical protein
MPGFSALRLNSQPYTLSILRIVVGLLYMEHGLAKILDFPHQPTHAPYALFTLNPGLQGLLELVGGCCSHWVGSPAPSPLSSWATWRLPISWCVGREVSSHCSMAGSWQSSTVSSFSISGSPAGANGASIDYAHPHPPYRQTGPSAFASCSERSGLLSSAAVCPIRPRDEEIQAAMTTGKFFVYLRVSTDKQGQSGLGIESAW